MDFFENSLQYFFTEYETMKLIHHAMTSVENRTCIRFEESAFALHNINLSNQSAVVFSSHYGKRYIHMCSR